MLGEVGLIGVVGREWRVYQLNTVFFVFVRKRDRGRMGIGGGRTFMAEFGGVGGCAYDCEVGC